MKNLEKKLSSLKSLFILEVLSHHSEYIGINKIAAISGYSQSTVHRILNEMIQCGYVEKSENYKKYKLGIHAVILASRFINSNSLITAARDELKELNRITGETVHLVSVSDFEIVYLDKIDTKHTLGLMSAVGKRNPLYCTAAGKAIMAFCSNEWIENFFSTVELKAYTLNTLADSEALCTELSKVRDLGYALDNCEHHNDIICIGAPIFSHSGSNPIAAISIAAPSYRFTIDMARGFAQTVMKSANNISLKLGST